MKNKKGFTLAETLLTLGIIGIVAALVLPMANSLRPDQTKIMYLKAFDSTSQAMRVLAANTRLFPIFNNAGTNCENYPFLNTDIPNDPKYNNTNPQLYRGQLKLCSLFAESLGVEAQNANCNAMPYNEASLSLEEFDEFFNMTQTFTTPNGMQWLYSPVEFHTNGNRFRDDVYVDINGNDSPNCIYNIDSCLQPDRFKFFVYANGVVEPADPVGVFYTETRTSLGQQRLQIEEENYPASNNTLEFLQ